MNFFLRKSIDELQGDATAEGHHALERSLRPLNLVTLGIGALSGTGIFVLTGTAGAQHVGPAIVLAFLLLGTGCVFAGDVSTLGHLVFIATLLAFAIACGGVWYLRDATERAA